jgi:glutathione S-transferase
MGITRHRILVTVAACNLILIVKFFITSIIQGQKRPRAPEDASKHSTHTSNATTTKTETTFDDIVRWQRIVINDLENIPLTLIAMWMSYFFSPDNLVTFIAAIVFTVARVLHSLCYIFHLQPFRTVFWVIGLLATLVLTCNVMYAASEHRFVN